MFLFLHLPKIYDIYIYKYTYIPHLSPPRRAPALAVHPPLESRKSPTKQQLFHFLHWKVTTTHPPTAHRRRIGRTDEATLVPDGLLEDAESLSASVENELVVCLGLLALQRWMYCWSRCSTWWGNGNLAFFFSVAEERETHSPGCFTGIMVGCSGDEYHRPTVDANVIRCCHARLFGRQRF